MSMKKDYSQEQVYDRGDIIYHPVFNESGKVKKVEWTVNHLQKLWVDFTEAGSKILIAGKGSVENQNKEI